MFLFPAFITPTLAVFGILLPVLVVPIAIVLLVVKFAKKLNRIERTLNEISEKLREQG